MAVPLKCPSCRADVAGGGATSDILSPVRAFLKALYEDGYESLRIDPEPDGSTIRDILKDYIEPRAVTIICIRYGLVTGRVDTLRDAGGKLGLTSERVRQLETKALRALRDNEAFMKELETMLIEGRGRSLTSLVRGS